MLRASANQWVKIPGSGNAGHSRGYAHAGEQLVVGQQVLKANLLAAGTIPLTAGILPVLASKTIPGLSVTAFSWVCAVVSFVAVVVCLTVYATLTASVLRAKLPAFSRPAWIGDIPSSQLSWV